MPDYRSDCSQCCGLCCVAPGQLAEQGFPVDKSADTPCVHLDGSHRCSIHSAREKHGYKACQSFDCFGAGQWVTQTLFGGANWTESPVKAQQMFAAYRYWAPRFEAAALIEAALPYVREDARSSLAEMMAELTSGDTALHRDSADAGRLRRETLSMIRSALQATNVDK